MTYHVPVLLHECIEGLNIKPDGIYVDVTFGGGGHTSEILKHITTGKVIAFDQDSDAATNAEKLDNKNLIFVPANFRYIKKYLRLNGYTQVDGLLADLGVSSHQFDTGERGFSTRFDGPLDMRMNKDADKSAQSVIASYSEKELHRIFGMYGEITNAKSLAAQIVKSRTNAEITTTAALIAVIRPMAPKGKENKYFAQVFQALRIEVNEELKALEELLTQSAEVIKKEGRLVIMSYHSLEDRLVKNFIKKGKFSGEVEKDVYGNFYVPFREVTRKAVEASDEEVLNNSRARSAKLRIAEKV